MGQCEPRKLNFGCTDAMEDNTYDRVGVSWSMLNILYGIYYIMFELINHILLLCIIRCCKVNPIIFLVWMGHKRVHC